MVLGMEDYEAAALRLGCDIPTIRAVVAVESRGTGFDPEGFPITLFEGHWFHRLTGGRYTSSHPTISYRFWTRVHYGRTWREEKKRLELATSLDREAALKSASWGLFQIMGVNHKECGFDTIQEFVNGMILWGEVGQLNAFVEFVRSKNLARFLRARDWVGFATRYNGPQYYINKYDSKLASAYSRFLTEV